MNNPPKFRDQNEDPSVELEIVEPSALEAINRAEVDIQIATAHRFPRSLAKFQKKALEMATLDEETAESCLYKLTRKDKNSPTGVKVIEGESIRMAEIVAASYGNMRIAAQITSQTPTKVTVRAVAHDLESNVLFAQEKVAKTTYKDGNPYSDDMAIIIANATISKAVRDAIFRVVPKALVKSIKEAAKQVAIGTVATLAVRREKALQWAGSLKIDMQRVFAVLGIKGAADLGLEELELLTGLKTAIREGDQTVEEAFPPIPKADSPPNFGGAPLGSEPAAQQGGDNSGSSGTAPAATAPQSGQPGSPAQEPKARTRRQRTETPVQEQPKAPETQASATTVAAPGETGPTTQEVPLTDKQKVAAFLDAKGIPIDDFRDWLTNSGYDDTSAIGTIEDLPAKVAAEILAEDYRMLKRCATLFATK